MGRQKPHAIVVPYPLQGHVTPTINLAISLASHGFTITFINTQSIHHQLAGDVFSGARAAGLDIRYTTVSDGLPIGFDRSLHHDRFMEALLHDFSGHMEEAIEGIVKTAHPAVNCLVADTFFVWPGKLAKQYGLLYVSFWTEAALVFALYYHLDLLMLNGHFGCTENREDEIDYIPGVQSIKPKDMTSYLQEENTTVVHQIISQAFMDVKSADFVLCNTVQDLEPQTILALHQKIPFFAIGPIFPKDPPGMSASTSLWSEADCSNWLDTKLRGTVLYVSFGSYAHVTKTDLIQLAYGLMQSKVDFLWALRPDIVSSDNNESPLPDEFREGVGERGMIVPWCNQGRVLAHPAIGGFLTHCGWNSLMESIRWRVPLLCFPLCTDQLTNRKLAVDDWHIGINLCDRSGDVSEAEVAEKIRRLMEGKDGDEARTAVYKVRSILDRAVADNGSSDTNMGCFVREVERKLSDTSWNLG